MPTCSPEETCKYLKECHAKWKESEIWKKLEQGFNCDF